MDNQEFDHILKGKLESFTPTYKEGAWEELNYKLDLIAPIPWYARWRSALIAGSLALITLINVGVWYKVNDSQSQMEQILEELTTKRSQSIPETIYVTTSDNYLGSLLTTSRSTTMAPLSNSNWQASSAELFDPLSIYKVSAGKNYSQSATSAQRLAQGFDAEAGLLPALAASRDQATQSYFEKMATRPVGSLAALDPFQSTYELQSLNGEDIYVRGIVVPANKNKWEHPLDLRVGLSSGYLIPDPDLGERFVSSRQSVYLETPIKGNMHALSGLSYQEMTYKLDDVDDNNFSQATLLRYPDFNSFDSSPDEIKVENQILQIPIYLRIYKPLNNKWSVFAGGGPTLDLLLKQKFTYSFLEIQNEQLVEFEEIRTSKEPQLSIGSISGHVGIEHYFSRRLAAQMELNYQYGLGRLGVEKRSFNSLSISGGLYYKLRSR